MTQFEHEIDPLLDQRVGQKFDQAIDAGMGPDLDAGTDQVPSSELNAWRRGFTPQAEIWNGRLAMVGLSVGLGVLLMVRLASH